MSESISIPNELKITINTSIPGFQKIKYKPTMTLKLNDKDDKLINFNPLVKLNPSVIKQVPEELRIREFFNKGLFNSLINLHGLKRETTLSKATQDGFVDNNIQVTLDTIFPLGSIIYVNKQPFVIGDVQWTTGNWKLDTKIKDEPILESSKITDPYLYSTVVKNEIISGEQELHQLPDTVIYGDNYDNSTASGKKPVTETNVTPTSLVTPTTPTTPTIPVKPVTLVTPTTPVKPLLPLIPPVLPSQLPLNEDELNYDIPVISPYINLQTAQKQTNFLKEYFRFRSNNYKDYFFIENMIFKNLDINYQTLFKKILQKTTITNINETSQNISTTAYTHTLDGLKVIQNPGGGDCFFIAVADAINYYNYSNPNKKIIYTNYGTDNSQLFTIHVLRSIVANFVIHDPNLNDILTNVIQINVDTMNDGFKTDIESKIANGIMSNRSNISEYMSSVNNIYKNNDNYLIDKITKIPTDVTNDDIYFKPYSILTSKEKIKEYIESPNYWANSVSIDVMGSVLGLSIVVIERKPNEILEIPYQTLNKNNNCDKYLFLYKYGEHYELITFDYSFKIIKENSKTKIITRKNTIFEIKQNEYLPPHFMPPYYILFLIFGAYYFKLVENSDKIDFLLYPEIFNAMNYSFDKIYNTLQSNTEARTFLNIFQKYFHVNADSEISRKYPDLIESESESGVQPEPRQTNQTRRRRPRIHNDPMRRSRRIRRLDPTQTDEVNENELNENELNENEIRGGAGKYRYVKSPKFIKKDDPYEKSNISYYISVDMELHKGTEVTKKEQSEMKCNQRWNAVKKSYSDFMGLKYVIKPNYSNSPFKKGGAKNITRKLNK